jgi:hypothetical protein
MDGVSQRGFFADLGQKLHSILCHLNVFFLATDVQNLLNFSLIIWISGDDEGTVQKIEGKTVRAEIVGTSNLGNTTVGGHDNNGCLIAFKGSVQE